jgi:hypothetical protein
MQALSTQEPMRLFAKDIEGTEWGGAWFIPSIDSSSHATVVAGQFPQLSARIAESVASEKEGSTGLYYAERLPLPNMYGSGIRITKGGRVISHSTEESQSDIDRDETWIKISKDPHSGFTDVLVQDHPELPQPIAEHALQDAMIYVLCRSCRPRVTVRYQDRSQLLFIRECRLSPRTGLPSALWRNATQWEALGKILFDFVRKYFNSHDYTSVEPAKIIYEVIGASCGTIHNFIAALVLAIDKLTMCFASEEKATNPADLRELRKHIQAWKGNAELKVRALSLMGMAGTQSPLSTLKNLEAAGVVTSQQIEKWRVLRPKLGHGGLVDYNDEGLALDSALMIGMFHRLILRTIGYRGPITDFSEPNPRFIEFDWKLNEKPT